MSDAPPHVVGWNTASRPPRLRTATHQLPTNPSDEAYGESRFSRPLQARPVFTDCLSALMIFTTSCLARAIYFCGRRVARSRCPSCVSQYSISPSAVPNMIEVPSGPRIRLLVGRAAVSERSCPVRGFQSRTIRPKPAYATKPMLETAIVFTYSECAGDTAMSCLVVRSQQYTRPSCDPIRIVPCVWSNAIGPKV